VGPCNDLIFGFSLVDYATTKGLKDGAVPKIVRICIQEIDLRGLESEGIYRVSNSRKFVHVPILDGFRCLGDIPLFRQ